jgi:hypothetical protein
MAVAMNTRPSWASTSPAGRYADKPDQVLPDQGPAQAVIGEMAAWLRAARGHMLLGGIVLGAIMIG